MPDVYPWGQVQTVEVLRSGAHRKQKRGAEGRDTNGRRTENRNRVCTKGERPKGRGTRLLPSSTREKGI